MKLAETAQRAMVIGGGSIYHQMIDYCDTAYVTKVHAKPESDTYFPNLDADPAWKLQEIMQAGEENGIAYEMCLYKRKYKSESDRTPILLFHMFVIGNVFFAVAEIAITPGAVTELHAGIRYIRFSADGAAVIVGSGNLLLGLIVHWNRAGCLFDFGFSLSPPG